MHNKSMIETDIELYTASFENLEDKFRRCHPADESRIKKLLILNVSVLEALKALNDEIEVQKSSAHICK